MRIKFDDKTFLVTDPNKNIVEIAQENGIHITAPCFRNKKKKGCCKACLIEVDGTQVYACGTKAQEGMEIVYQRKDLVDLRKERLTAYAKAIKSGQIEKNACDCNSPFPTTSSCCSSHTGCC